MNEGYHRTVLDKIAAFNEMYNLQNIPLEAMHLRQEQFLKIIKDEVSEGDDILRELNQKTLDDLDALVAMADWLGDVIVYCVSEALRYNLPINQILHIIMDSNESKLGPDGKPIHHPETGKVMKGPNYWKPEPKIKELLIRHGNQTQEGI